MLLIQLYLSSFFSIVFNRIILRVSELTTFRLTHDKGTNAKPRKTYWLGLIRSRSERRIDHYVSTIYFPTTAQTNPFTPLKIAYATTKGNDKPSDTSQLVTHTYLPARLTESDHTSINNYKKTNWKFVTTVGDLHIEALQVWGTPNDNLILPTISLYNKIAYRDLDLKRPAGHDGSRKFTTPAQQYDINQNNKVNCNNILSPSDDEMNNLTDVDTTTPNFTQTIPVTPQIVAPPTSIQQQLQTVPNSDIIRHQRDFPAPGCLNRPEFRHILDQLNPSDPSPYPNIYLRLTISVNHVYHVYIADIEVLKKLPCITVIDGDKKLHFAPIQAVSQKFLGLYKCFSKANTGQLGKWIPLPHLPDLAFLSKLIPMREHHALVFSIMKLSKK